MGNILTSLLNSTNALQVYGSVFNTIQNNISNANTPGYAKQDQSLLPGPEGGVQLGPLISSRSQFLEQAIRRQQGQASSATQKTNDLLQLQPAFDVTGQGGVAGGLSNFFSAFSQLAVSPNDLVSRQNVLNSAQTVALAFKQNASAINQLSTNIDSQARAVTASINQLAQQIGRLNRDLRNNASLNSNPTVDAQATAALEQLSQLVHFSTVKTPDGAYNVYLGGQTPLVIGTHVFSVSADFSAPTTAIRDSQNNDITAELAGKGGSLGALLDEKNTILPGYTVTLNSIAQTFADSVNTQLGQGLDRNGNAPAANLFTYNTAVGAAYTLGVNPLIVDDIAAASAGAPGGNGNALAVSQLATRPLINGFTLTQTFGNLAGQVGNDISSAQQDQAAQQDLLLQAQQQRAQVSGVSLNEEAAKLVQFQQAYEAVGRYVSVMKSLTDTLLSMTQ